MPGEFISGSDVVFSIQGQNLSLISNPTSGEDCAGDFRRPTDSGRRDATTWPKVQDQAHWNRGNLIFTGFLVICINSIHV